MDNLHSELEKAEYLQNLLVAQATGGTGDEVHYKLLRSYFLNNPSVSELTPDFIRSNRELFQFWNFIKHKFIHYQERRQFIWTEFKPLLDYLEGANRKPADDNISDVLRRFDAEGVHAAWSKAIDRRTIDPEGAITAARTLLETVCKHILDNSGVYYERNKIDLPELYKLTAKELKLAPSQHTLDIFKQILGGVTSVVTGLGALRNRLGDAHGQGKRPIRPAPRHAQLAVNLAGTVALYLVETWMTRVEERNNGIRCS